MTQLTASRLRRIFLDFMREKGHALIPSASVIPQGNVNVLFTIAGMYPLIPYLMGETHPCGKRLANAQKCIRTIDIESVGDASHLTFFEMLGNWSLGDYFKKEAITWSWEFLTDSKWLGINPDDLAFSVFAGDDDAPRDEEAADLWRSVGVKEDKIFYLPKENNWWSTGGPGPCGPDTEMFFVDPRKPYCGPDCSPACDCGKFLEIWNNVFMQYNLTDRGILEPLANKSVDTGMGLERTACVIMGKQSVYETDLFGDIISRIIELTGKSYGHNVEVTRSMRIIADHLRTACMILGDDHAVTPSNTDQGYILRRLIRRAVRHGMTIGLPDNGMVVLAKVITAQYQDIYPELLAREAFITEQLNMEVERFQRTLKTGMKEFDRLVLKLSGTANIDGANAFRLFDTYGFPIEMTEELAFERGLSVDKEGFHACYQQHRALSHSGADQKFKGGLADGSNRTAALHTATHLLHAALRTVLGNEVAQKGSNITEERLRFDFSFGRKMTQEEIRLVQERVNEAIKARVEVIMEEMTVDSAKACGALGLFESRYGDVVKVYTMGAFSKEICGGPHAKNTGDLGAFIIQKEESSSGGVRRIKAILTDYV